MKCQDEGHYSEGTFKRMWKHAQFSKHPPWNWRLCITSRTKETLNRTIYNWREIKGCNVICVELFVLMIKWLQWVSRFHTCLSQCLLSHRHNYFAMFSHYALLGSEQITQLYGVKAHMGYSPCTQLEDDCHPCNSWVPKNQIDSNVYCCC